MFRGILVSKLLISALFLVASVSSASADSPNRLALLIGIDKYQKVNDLRGAVNDVRRMHYVLTNKFGLDKENVHVLTNEQATRDGIINAIREHLIAKARPGDVAILYYAGHGSQMRDISGDETDGRDETIIPHDSRTPGVFDISDDELNGLLQQLTRKTKNVTVILDSCNSGAGIRAGGSTVRSIPMDDRPPPPPADFALSRGGAGEGSDGFSLRDSDYVLISGSRADQLSNEGMFEGQRHGAMTWFLTKALLSADGETTYRDVMDSVTREVENRLPSQEPQLEGRGTNLVLFGVERIFARPFVLVEPLRAGRVKVEAGKALGVRNGATLKVYPPRTRNFETATVAAVIEVVDAKDFESEARITEGVVAKAGSRAILEAATFGHTSIPVHVAGAGSGLPKEVRAGLRESTSLNLVESERDAQIIVRQENGQISVTSGDLEDFVPSIPTSDELATKKVIDRVKDITHWLTVLSLENPNSRLKVDFTIRRKDSPTSTRAPSEVQTDTRVTYKVTNNSNTDLYITVLDVSSDGSIELLFPLDGEQQVLPKGDSLERDIRMFVPEGVASVTDTLKVFATKQPINASVFPKDSLRAPRVEARRRGPVDPLTHFLDNAIRGVGLRAAAPGPVKVDQWTTRQRILRVSRATSELRGFSLHFDETKSRDDVAGLVSDTRALCAPGRSSASCSRVAPASQDGSSYHVTDKRQVPIGKAFDEAYELQDKTGAKRVEPDLDIPVDRVVTQRGIESRSVLGDEDHDDLAKDDNYWSLKQLRVFDAWKKIRDKHGAGEGKEAIGILIAHPDTGYLEHPELWKEVNGIRPLDVSKGYNFYEQTSDPKDRLLSNRPTDNPGHGTASGSVIVSPAGCQMPNETKCADGIARGAQLIPLRVHRTVAQFNPSKLAEAIDAIAEGEIEGNPKLISIAMGGPPNYGLGKAVRKAEKKGILIIAASGNYVRTVVWPARFSSTIAVAANNIRCGPWKHSSRGDAVDISAPGESVWRASIDKDHDFIVGMSKGTTFATGNVSGTAALWLAYHHGDPKMADLRSRGAVTRVFRNALRESAWRPNAPEAPPPDGTHCIATPWDGQFGAGIVDIASLLDEPLNERPAAAVAAAPSLDRLPLFASLYPSGTDTAQIVSDYLAIFGRTDEGQLGELERFETEILHHYTLDENVREGIEGMIGRTRDTRGAKIDTARQSLRDADISSTLREALAPRH